jgi:hypothetical protein
MMLLFLAVSAPVLATIAAVSVAIVKDFDGQEENK